MEVKATVALFADSARAFRLDDTRWPEGRWALLLEDLATLSCDYAYELCRDTVPPEPTSYNLDDDLSWWLWIDDPALALEFKLRWG